MITLYQYCEQCKTETNFNPTTVECLKCKHKCLNYTEKEKKQCKKE